MNKEEFIKKIKEINATVPNEYFFLEYNKCVCDILEENQELKKQLEEKENQQKEFMEWLESESHRLSGDVLLNSSFIEVRTILLKYKEIIGDKE